MPSLPSVRFLLTALLLFLVPMNGVHAQARSPKMNEADRLLRASRYGDAAKVLEGIVSATPDQGRAWLWLGEARYHLGDHAGAVAAQQKASQFPSVRANALYNLACAAAVMGRPGDAVRALHEAVQAGFLDFDLMKRDPDLESLRKTGRLPLPEPRTYQRFGARNGVQLGYHLVLPADYEPGSEFPAIASFAPGGWGPASTDWALEHLWSDAPPDGWIVLHLVAPKDGWMSHPAHHALEELLESIRAKHGIEDGRFHLVGFGEGSRPATNYAGMSRAFARSLTTVSNHSWAAWSDREIRGLPRMPYHLIVGARDRDGLAISRTAVGMLGPHAHLEVLEGEGLFPESMLDGGLMRYIARHLGPRAGS